MKINDGRLDVTTGGLTVTGRVRGSLYGVVMTSADSVTTITNGRTLTATNGVQMQKGMLATFVTSTPGVNQIATIDGRFLMEDGTIGLGVDGYNYTPTAWLNGGSIVSPTYCTLKVTGITKLLGGTFMTKLHPTLGDTRDAIDTDDKFYTTVNFKIQPLGAAPSGGTPVLVSKLGFTDDSVLPTVVNNNGNTYTVAWTNGKKHLTVSPQVTQPVGQPTVE